VNSPTHFSTISTTLVSHIIRMPPEAPLESKEHQSKWLHLHKLCKIVLCTILLIMLYGRLGGFTVRMMTWIGGNCGMS
jgi:hypothetical protein